MPIKVKRSKSEIKKWVEQRINLFLLQIRQAADNVGLEAVTISRQQHTYTDQTGNLTSSVGYAIVENGKILIQDFQIADKGDDCVTGKNTGEAFMKELASKYASGMYLIIVAGMPYAAYVEARGYDVLDSAKIHATNEIKRKVNDVMKLWQH